MNKNQILNPKTHKYTIYGLIALTIIMLLSLLASCDGQPTQPSYAQQQAPAHIQQPVEYGNEVHNHYYNNDNTGANLAAAAAGYATNKYMDKQKQVTTLTPSKVNPSPVPVTKLTTSKPSFSYLTSKSSNIPRSTRRK